MTIFQKRLVEQRKLLKMTQIEMAEYLKIKQPSYIRYENGSAEPNFETLVKLAKLFDVSTDYLIGLEDK